GTHAPWSHRLRASHGSWACAGRNETWPPSTAGSSDRGPPDNQRVAVSCSLSLPLMGQDVGSPIHTSLCPSASVTGLSNMKCNARTSPGHHNSQPPAHRTITGERGGSEGGSPRGANRLASGWRVGSPPGKVREGPAADLPCKV